MQPHSYASDMTINLNQVECPSWVYFYMFCARHSSLAPGFRSKFDGWCNVDGFSGVLDQVYSWNAVTSKEYLGVTVPNLSMILSLMYENLVLRAAAFFSGREGDGDGLQECTVTTIILARIFDDKICEVQLECITYPVLPAAWGVLALVLESLNFGWAQVPIYIFGTLRASEDLTRNCAVRARWTGEAIGWYY